jgi:hypothetical protein
MLSSMVLDMRLLLDSLVRTPQVSWRNRRP